MNNEETSLPCESKTDVPRCVVQWQLPPNAQELHALEGNSERGEERSICGVADFSITMERASFAFLAQYTPICEQLTTTIMLNSFRGANSSLEDIHHLCEQDRPASRRGEIYLRPTRT
jgi:hypothetical protein